MKKWLAACSHFDSHFDRGPKAATTPAEFWASFYQILQPIYDSRSHFMILAATFIVSRSHFGQVAGIPDARMPHFLKV